MDQGRNRHQRHRGIAVLKTSDQDNSQGGTNRASGRSRFAESDIGNRCLALIICVSLSLAVILVFGQTARYEFVDVDDPAYVYQNAHVAHGLSTEGILWAFTYRRSANWRPLTWLSLMADCQLYGLNAGGHHLTNVVLHAATAVLLFLVLWRMTGRLWPSALAAALFAIHPLRAESVAWVTERKDVLSGLMFMLTLVAYVDYVRRPFLLRRYLLVTLVFVLGLMTKPMLITLPFLLLLLDYWPLARFPLSWRLVNEKLPLLLLSLLSCAVAVLSPSETVKLDEFLPFGWRIANALVSYVVYLRQFFCPTGLAVYYPNSVQDVPLLAVVGAAVLLAAISAVVVACGRRFPYLPVGWFWYVGMMLPVIGLVRFGVGARADRFTYLPQIGLGLALVWGAVDLHGRRRYLRGAGSAAAAVVLALLVTGAWCQTAVWHDSVTLWTHAVACTARNDAAHFGLGSALLDAGRFEEAMAHYEKASEIRPDNAMARHALATTAVRLGRHDEAVAHYRKLLELEPNDASTHRTLADLLAGRGRFEEAVVHYREALRIQPDDAMVCNNLGAALVLLGRLDEALVEYQRALKLSPDYARVYCNMGDLSVKRGRFAEALRDYQQAVSIQSDLAMARGKLAWLLATNPEPSLRNGAMAIEHARRADQLCGGKQPEVLDVLAAAYAEVGRFSEAVATAHKALDLATQQHNHGLANALRDRIALYKIRKPYRQPLSALAPAKP